MTSPVRPVPPAPQPAPGGPGKGIQWGKQVGPLPIGAWVAVIGGALAIAAFAAYKKRQGGPAIVEDTSGVPGVGTGANSLWVQTNAPPTEVARAFETNEEWARAAINYLIAQGYDPALSDTAVRKYLESTALSLAENALIKIALAHFGSPPRPLPAPPEQPSVPKPPETTPPNPAPPLPPNGQRWVVVTPWPSKFGSLWGIASYYYGRGADWPRIYNANRIGVTRPDGTPGKIKNPDLIYPGQRLFVP
jgi:hypothetical protein